MPLLAENIFVALAAHFEQMVASRVADDKLRDGRLNEVVELGGDGCLVKVEANITLLHRALLSVETQSRITQS